MKIAALKSKTEDTRDEILAKADDVAAKGAEALDKVSEKAKDATELAVKEISDLISTLNEKIAALGSDADTLGEKAKGAYAQAEAFVSKEVAERPLRTLAVVGLAGLAIGLLTRK